jgi:hypothetical protein
VACQELCAPGRVHGTTGERLPARSPPRLALTIDIGGADDDLSLRAVVTIL